MSALTAEFRSCTTIASAKEPRAAATALSYPFSIEIRELTLPRIFTPRELASNADAPSLLFEVMRRASSFASTAFFSRSVLRSLSTRSASVFFAASNVDFADSNCESKPSSLESALAISNSNVE